MLLHKNVVTKSFLCTGLQSEGDETLQNGSTRRTREKAKTASDKDTLN